MCLSGPRTSTMTWSLCSGPSNTAREESHSVGREIWNFRQSCRIGYSRRLAQITNRIRCSSTSTAPSHPRPHPRAVLPAPSQTRASVKDVLITPCKGCHETEHRNACATGAAALR